MIGLVVNPIAGLGGPAGLKGSDGENIQAEAIRRGSQPRAGGRAELALREFARADPTATVLTAAGVMGEDAVRAAGLTPRVVYASSSGSTNATDTVAAAKALVEARATLLLFAGGDGTARDVCSAQVGDTPVLGIPSGVKMYSGCFAVSPVAAGAIAGQSIGSRPPTQRREVLDVAEDEVRAGRVDPTLYGYLDIPVVPGRTQARKASSSGSESDAVRVAARGITHRLQPDVAYLLGPGSTMTAVAEALGVPKTSLGVDVIKGGERVLADASESQLIELVRSVPAKAVVTVIGGQGFLLGRGNQQLSAGVLRELGNDPLLVVATEEKLLGLGGRPLLVDTGDAELDNSLAGYIRVVTGESASSLYRVVAANAEVSRPVEAQKESN